MDFATVYESRPVFLATVVYAQVEYTVHSRLSKTTHVKNKLPLSLTHVKKGTISTLTLWTATRLGSLLEKCTGRYTNAILREYSVVNVRVY